ncbi:protein of unknown function [Candidatus Methylomirabilis oxygeniifera]|uniref:Uncharacterized protein n=1 Tax=Methylomirabilis oxygeniifera TaxID=671143 RepID=D5MJB6_METO1|nr:protein of unknown function [Candidatus Methylomirabilis oxyfera]
MTNSRQAADNEPPVDPTSTKLFTIGRVRCLYQNPFYNDRPLSGLRCESILGGTLQVDVKGPLCLP